MRHEVLSIGILCGQERQDLGVRSIIITNPIIFIEATLVTGPDPGRLLVRNGWRKEVFLGLNGPITAKESKDDEG